MDPIDQIKQTIAQLTKKRDHLTQAIRQWQRKLADMEKAK